MGRKNTGAEITDKETTIDLVELASHILSKWEYVLMGVLLGALVLNAVSFFLMKPTYKSTAKLYIVTASGDSVIDLTDLNIGTNLTNDYQELIMSYPVLDQVIQILNLDMTSSKLAGLISVTNPTSTRVLTLTATTNDPELSMNIANTLAGVAIEYLPETMSTNKPNVAQVAKLPTEKSSPSYTKNTILGALIGFVLIVGLFTVQFIFDDTVKTQEDVESLFNVAVLSIVPENKQMHLDDRQDTKKHKRNSVIRRLLRSAKH